VRIDRSSDWQKKPNRGRVGKKNLTVVIGKHDSMCQILEGLKCDIARAVQVTQSGLRAYRLPQVWREQPTRRSCSGVPNGSGRSGAEKQSQLILTSS
jgi:hypothetical protein